MFSAERPPSLWPFVTFPIRGFKPDCTHQRASAAAFPTASSTGAGGVSGGKTTSSDVTITKRTDSCSPLLFGDVVRGTHIKKVTILQQHGNKDDVFQLTLEDVIISSYQLSGDESHEVPTEQLSFSFTTITITDLVTGAKFGWNLVLNKGL